MIQEILEAAAQVKNKDKKMIESIHLKNNKASLTVALFRIRYLLYDEE